MTWAKPKSSQASPSGPDRPCDNIFVHFQVFKDTKPTTPHHSVNFNPGPADTCHVGPLSLTNLLLQVDTLFTLFFLLYFFPPNFKKREIEFWQQGFSNHGVIGIQKSSDHVAPEQNRREDNGESRHADRR